MLKLLIGGPVAVAALGLVFYVRAAPYDAERWHRAPESLTVGDYPANTGFQAIRAITTPPEDMLRAVDAVALGTPRTERVSGAPDTGLMTYETRTPLMRYPDYTTVAIIPGERPLLSIHGRARFGQSDMGVNRARVEDWLARLGPLVVPPS